jgi:hypothetical protein
LATHMTFVYSTMRALYVKMVVGLDWASAALVDSVG